MSQINTNPSNQDIVIKFGAPVLKSTFKKLKLISSFLALLLLADIFFSLRLFVNAVQIRTTIGYFINMITDGDGDILPTMQAIPVLFFIVLDALMGLLACKSFDHVERRYLNHFMFGVVALSFVLSIAVFVVIIAVLIHVYGEHGSLHDGITTAMSNYSSNMRYKFNMDMLQIEFQCCGSKKYDEWYAIKWFDSSLYQEGESCCSMRSLFPCIHHNIEVTGKTYLYTPEENLSISTRGCYDMIRQRKQEVGWGVVGNLTLYLVLQALTLAAFRFLQTAHFYKSRFWGNNRTYTIWLFGCYRGTVKRDNEAPEPPPVPPELME